MAERVVLHVGTMKSGTSYLQSLLFAQKAGLAERGVLVPGQAWADQARAVRQAVSPGNKPRPLWEAFAAEVSAHPGAAVVSMEYLAAVPPKQATSLVKRLGSPQVSVVITARDLNRSLVSMWQETIQNGRSWRWDEYVADVKAKAPGGFMGVVDRTTPGGTFWRQQNLVRMARSWGKAVGADNVVVVTVPPPGAPPRLLAERFAEASDLDLDLEAPVVRTNESLGLASVLVLQRLNALLDAQGLPYPAGSPVRKRLLAKQVMAARKHDEPAMGLEVAAWLVGETAATVAALCDTRLVGAWSDLDPVAVTGVAPADVDEAAVTEAAVAALAGLIAARAR